MTIALAMIARDEAAVLERCLLTAIDVIDDAVVVDTGSLDDTASIAARLLAPDCVIHRPWRSFGENLTEAREFARERSDWVLRLDADMTVAAHPGFLGWFDENTDPDVVAWTVEIVEADIVYRLPLLTRSDTDATYVGATHEYLDIEGKQRPLLGLTVTHHHDGSHRPDKHRRDLDLLRLGYAAGDARATYYYADALRCLGETDAAIDAYRARAAMVDTFEEERWHAQYRAAALARDVDALLEAHRARPWRHEPLTEAARIIGRGPATDRLFHENPPI